MGWDFQWGNLQQNYSNIRLRNLRGSYGESGLNHVKKVLSMIVQKELRKSLKLVAGSSQESYQSVMSLTLTLC